jgi:RNA polymerase sigma factor (TIGR02999 family)
MSDVTQLLQQIESGNGAAADPSPPLVYTWLRKLAAAKLAHERPGQTLQATALVHEACSRLVGGGQHWDNTRRPSSAAAEVMRRILVENARRKGRLKRGGASGGGLASQANGARERLVQACLSRAGSTGCGPPTVDQLGAVVWCCGAGSAISAPSGWPISAGWNDRPR